MIRIVIFQQKGSGEHKIRGIRKYGKDILITSVFDITENLTPVVDDPERIIPRDFEGDLVLSFLQHPDLIEFLADCCRQKGIPMIASGKKVGYALTPFTCCGLGHHQNLGAYGEQFGLPEFNVTVADGKIATVAVTRGASCGATWEAASRIIGLAAADAPSTFAREVQYLCCADPSAFDPISGKSPLHYAGKVHIAALKKALAVAGSPLPD